MADSIHATVMPDGSLRLDPEARARLSLRPGDHVEILAEDRTLIVRPRIDPMSLAGSIKSDV